MKTLMLVVGLTFGAAAAFAAKGDLVPENKPGVAVLHTKLGAVAEVQTRSFKVDLAVTSGNGILYVKMRVWNTGKVPLNVDAGALKLETEGSATDPLSPEKYVAAVSDYRPYPVDAAGRIHKGGPEPEPDLANTGQGGGGEGGGRGGGMFGGMGGGRGGKGGRGGRGGSKSNGPGTPDQRMQATKELQTAKQDILFRGGVVAPGQTAAGRHAYPRTGLELPFVVTFQPPGSSDTATVSFVREK